MSPRQRIIAFTARFTPKILPAILKGGISQIENGDQQTFMDALYQKNTHDRGVLENSTIADAVHEGYSFAVAQGHRAFQVDAMHVTRDWSEYTNEVRQPVLMIHGTHDPVVTAQSVHDFASQYENFEVHEQRDSGQLIFYELPDLIVRMVGEFEEKTR